MDLSPEELDKRYQEVPLDIRLALSSEEFAQKIFDIAEEHGLLLDQADALSEIVALIMLGVTPRQEFHDKVSALGIPDEAVSGVTKDINEKILEPLKRALREAEEGREEGVSREEILREIERPSPTAFSRAALPPSIAETHNAKVLGSEEVKAAETPEKTEISLPPIMDPSHEIEAPHQPKPPFVAPSLAETEEAKTPVAPEPLRISPKVAEAPQVTAPQNPLITQVPRVISEVKPSQPEKRPAVDPYREPIE